MTSSVDSITRRDVLKLGGASYISLAAVVSAGVGGLAYEEQVGAYDPISTFISLNRGFESADAVARGFAEADSAFLMASYVVFFPQLLSQRDFQSVELLREAAQRQKRISGNNHHRLDALPSVASAHLLKTTKDKSRRDELSQNILIGVNNQNREIQQIVLQNLMTSAIPNYDSVRYFATNSAVISRIAAIIKEANDNLKLMSNAVHGLEFLLNGRALLKARGAPQAEIEVYNRAIGVAQKSKAAHMQYMPLLIKSHEDVFQASGADVNSLPPHSSEALIGWEKLGSANRKYFSILSLMRSHLLYTVHRTALGAFSSDINMSSDEARIASSKIIEFIRAFKIDVLLDDPQVLELASKFEPNFAKFLRSEFVLLLRSTNSPINPTAISNNMIAIKRHVPFAQFTNEHLVTLATQEDATVRRALFAGFGRGLSTFGCTQCISLITWIVNALKVADNRTLPTESLKNELVDKVREEVAAFTNDVDGGKYEGVDQQQARLGNITIL